MNAIVTGASRGIGRGIAGVLGKNGLGVGLLARSEDELLTLQEEISAAGGRAAVAVCDVRDPESAKKAVDEVCGALGGVDALVNNAGFVVRKSVDEISVDEWRLLVETNVNGVFYMIRAVLPVLMRQKQGHIVNVSSISGRVPLPGGSAYAATKYAVTGFSQSIFQELRDHGIKVTTVYPGSVATGSRHAGEDQGWKVHPEEVGQAILNLLRTAPGTVISELEIRPLNRPPG